MKRFRGGLVCKAHRLVYDSTLGWRVIQKKKKKGTELLGKTARVDHGVGDAHARVIKQKYSGEPLPGAERRRASPSLDLF